MRRGDVALDGEGGIYPQAAKLIGPEGDQAIEEGVKINVLGSEEDHR